MKIAWIFLLKEPRATVAKVKCSALGNSGQTQRPLGGGHRQEEGFKGPDLVEFR